jgi:endonuclease/exonuclease/phosphatase family metal-dependent hydrolase
MRSRTLVITVATALLIPFLLAGCGLNRDSDFGSGPVKPLDTTITALRELQSGRPVDTLRVGTLNMSIGFPVAQLLFLDFKQDSVGYRALDTIVNRYKRGRPEMRVKLMAKAIADAKLDVVGLQEVLLFSTQDSAVYDFYHALKGELENLTGQPWQGMRQVLNDTTLLANWQGKNLKVFFAEGNAFLVRQGLTLTDTAAVNFSFVLPIQIEGAKPSMRSYIRAKVIGPKGSPWQVYNTHLEVLEPYRSAQAAEFAKVLVQSRVLGEAQLAFGDYNDEPEVGATHVMSESGMRDMRDLAKVDPVITCCVDDTRLWDAQATLSGRILDYVFAYHIVGAYTWQAAWSQALPLEDGTSLWPGDHILVHGTVASQ